MRMHSALLRFAGLLLLLLCLSCGGGSSHPAGDEVEVVPFASTRMLSESDLSSLQVDANSGLLTFARAPAALKDVKPGAVLVAGQSQATPQGLLRVVKTVRSQGEALELDTLHAPLQLAFQKVHIKAARRSTGELAAMAWPDPNDPLAFRPYRKGVGATQKVRVVVFDGDGDVSTTNDQVLVDGELGGTMDFDFSLDFDWGALEDLPKAVEDCIAGLLEAKFECSLTDLLPEAKAVFEVTPALSSQLELHGASILGFEKEFVLFQSNLGVLVFGPVIVTPHVDILARVEGSASAAFRTSVNAAISFTSSVTLSSKSNTPKFTPPELEDVTFDAEPPELTLKAEAKAGLGAELSLLIYGVTGPYLSARAFGAVSADVFRKPCMELSAGLEGSLGVKLTTPAFLFLDPIDLLDWHADLGPIEETLDVSLPMCTAPPDASKLPPGSGPDAEHVAMPTFAPWSRSFGPLMDGAAANPGGTTYSLDQEHSIDGRVVIVGRGGAGVTKIDEAGKLVWSRQLFADAGDANSLLRPSHVTSAQDATLVVLAEPRVPPLSVVKLTQAGNALFRQELSTSDDIACGVKPAGLVSDGESGFYAVLGCSLSDRILVAHLGAKGEVLSATSYGDAEASVLEPTSVLNVGSELFVAGRIARPTDSMFAMRIDGKGALKFAKRYEACPEGPDVYPVRAIVEKNGDVTVAGRGGAEHNGFLARIKADGKVGFAAFPGFGFGLGSVFVLDGLAQLSTTGYVVSGSTVRFTAEAATNVASIALLQLDAVGKPVWAQRYTLQTGASSFAPAAQTDMMLTDDGGVLVTAIAQREPTALTADVWSMKVPARDGKIDFTAGQASVTPIDTNPDDSVVALPCSLTDVAWEVSRQDEPMVTTRLAPVEAVPLAPEALSQTP